MKLHEPVSGEEKFNLVELFV